MSDSMESLYANDVFPIDERDENYESSEEEREYYCEVCDREFPSEECLTKHIGEHRVCGIDGCVFSAHSKLVDKHISMQHSTGLYNRMKNLSTPEDIENWITERKKRYPTKANIEHQAAEAAEKRKRYEVIREKKTTTEFKTARNETKKITKRKARRKFVPVPASTKISETLLYRGLEPFPGTLCLQEPITDTENSLIEDSDNETDVKDTEEPSNIDKVVQINNNEENNASSLSLVADYGTDSDIDDAPEEVPFKKTKIDVEDPPIVSTVSNLCRTKVDVEDPPIVSTVSNLNVSQNESGFKLRCHNDRKNKQDEVEKNQPNDKKFKNERQRKRFQKTPNENQNSRNKMHKTKNVQLLNKLLSRSIQRERNLISQCIKYIVDNNYFQ